MTSERYAALLSRAIKRLDRLGRHLTDEDGAASAVGVLLDFRKTSANADQVPPSGSATPAVAMQDFGSGFGEDRFDGLNGLLQDWVSDDEPSLGLFSWFELPAAG